jgi:hypothetical protein
MPYSPEQENSENDLMELWRKYLESYANREGDVEGQIVAGAYSTVEILSFLSRTLDGEGRYRGLIDQRTALFREGSRNAGAFEDCLINATFSIYNCLNTLAHQLSGKNQQASAMLRSVDEQAHLGIESGTQVVRSAAAMRAGFALAGLITIALDEQGKMTPTIRQLEQRFASGARAAASGWDHLLNALYRIVELMQIIVLLTAPELKDRIAQIASRFQEEDRTKDRLLKLRNGFCRFFDLGHLLGTHLDSIA